MAHTTLAIVAAFMISTIASLAHAQTASETCGPKAPLIKRIFTDAEEIRIKCIDDYFEKQKQETEKLIEELRATILEQKKNLDKSAHRVDPKLFRVYCNSPKGDRDKALVAECEKNYAIYTSLQAQLKSLTEWDVATTRPVGKTAEEVEKNMQLPCPDEQTLESIRSVRLFSKRLYQTYERCFTLAH